MHFPLSVTYIISSVGYLYHASQLKEQLNIESLNIVKYLFQRKTS